METNPVPPDVRWAIATWSDDAPRGAVSAFCVEHQISRSVFYKIQALAREHGPGAVVVPGSRAPATSPGRVGREGVDQALAVRADLARRGLDHGPLSVIDQMRRAGLHAPSRATLARYFRAEGVVVPDPRKRPRAANRRFVHPAPNCMWQIDAFDWTLADGSPATVFQVIDDHSRRILASLAARGETSANAIEVVGLAIDRFGVPLRFLSDNGAAFNPTRRGHTGALVELLRSLGVVPLTGKPGKPTTQGKNERVHKTTIKFLNARPAAATITELQAQLDTHDEHYNVRRGHQSLGMATPVEAWNATPVAGPPPLPVNPPLPVPPVPSRPLPLARTAIVPSPVTTTVTSAGRAQAHGTEFHVGKPHAGTEVTITYTARTVTITTSTGHELRTYARPADGTRHVGPRTHPAAS
ncbi:DDE-type integrase/transposase/recombinase [Luteimicrobium sp. DT211]|uniref:DDE-type integrase/transposase/recombinase n=1 Tax=Luteimicrobium sp. DT211 TaxID=3393412 RepID=UPI003CF3431E